MHGKQQATGRARLTFNGVDEVIGSIKDLDIARTAAALGGLLRVAQHITYDQQSQHQT